MNEESAKLTLSKFARSVHYTERSDFSSTSPRWSLRLSWWTASRCPKPLISSKPVWSLCSECFCEIDRAPCAPGWKIGKLCSPPFVRACTPCSMRETYEQSTRGSVSSPISGIKMPYGVEGELQPRSWIFGWPFSKSLNYKIKSQNSIFLDTRTIHALPCPRDCSFWIFLLFLRFQSTWISLSCYID